MENEAWPSPQTPRPSREPLPRVEDLPVAEQGYEQESVKAAFDSFYRHAAQLDAALRTLEAVDSFHRQAAALRSDLRALRAAGWTQQSWTAPPTYGYGIRAPREGIPPAVWRIGGEVAFLVTVAVVLGVAKLSWWAILLAMAMAFAIVCVIEWLAGREQFSFARPAETAPVFPVVEAQRIEDTQEGDASGWTAFEEAQEPSDAMTMVAAPPREEAAKRPVRAERGPGDGDWGNREVPPEEDRAEAEEESEPPEEPEPAPAPEPELPPAAEADEGRKHWWQRRGEAAEEDAEPEPEPPRHVRVLPTGEAPADAADPWEAAQWPGREADQGKGSGETGRFPQQDPWEAGLEGEPGEPDEETEEPALVVEEEPRRRFRRR